MILGHMHFLELPCRSLSLKWVVPYFLTPWQLETDNLKDKKPISDNIERHARNAKALFIWTDCDREGEHIGAEVRGVATRVKPNIEVKRAKFSNIEKRYVIIYVVQDIAKESRHVIQAARRPVLMDDRQVAAVNARIELDLRIGFAFTRMQTRSLQILGSVFDRKVISYGKPVSCMISTKTDNYRILSISNSWICSRSILARTEFRARTILEYQDNGEVGRYRGDIPLETESSFRSCYSHYSL